MKTILGVYSAPRPHWVGDGFPVRSLFSYNSHGRDLSPFLLLDYAGPHRFAPAAQPRGVGQHPHRGFETVTIVYEGEVEHRDSTGAGGKIGPGDVQWMTAASGILHEEFHSRDFTRTGGTLEMVQLWVNLPAKDKMAAPGYQTLLAADIPNVELPDGAGRVRVIAGEFDGQRGPGPHLHADGRLGRAAPCRQGGRVRAARGPHARRWSCSRARCWSTTRRSRARRRWWRCAREGRVVTLEANSDATVLLLSGEPIDEPIVGYGPFVMNTQEEIGQAIADFKSGKFGRMQ